ncbi:phosphatase PAP2 family protein [Aminobacter sp. AP02]|uniref:phosphatase PAP2 family protein n=1 Tax=Aminobacter sp. AP02 TaxID=2135737 RepID=UPI000D6D8F67|nr:phosphatase PAP2 family protein [Aminobacter sp. AP02]PWK69807.1 PAP2 superfamily protein [Aminobacter sp. AP02]
MDERSADVRFPMSQAYWLRTNDTPGLVGFFKTNWRVQGVFLVAASIVVVARLLFLPNALVVMSNTSLQSLRVFVVSCAIAICLYLVPETIRTRSLSKSFEYLWSEIFTWRNFAVVAPAIVALALVMNTFSQFKSSIPVFHPYAADELFQRVDRFVHFGVDPWRIVGHFFEYGGVTVIIDRIYYLWFIAVFVPTAAVVGMPDRFGIRHQFLLTYVLVWAILGIVCATAFSSVGPIYYDRVYGGPSHFTDLVQNLVRTDSAWGLTTMQVREVLWSAYVDDTATVISGISAMPSIHNAMCVLLFLAARHVNRWLAVATAIFGLTIFIGSIHLGWHYAIDAYVSVIGVVLLWKLAGYLTGNAAMRRAVQSQPRGAPA